MTRGEQFAGLTVALVTPFKNGEIDYPELQKLVDWHIEQGTDCLAPVGTTGESPTLDHDEHEHVIAAVCEYARGRIKVMPGTGSNSTREAIRLTKFAKKVGADGRSLLQQADAGGLLSPLRRGGGGGGAADRAVQHSRPHRLEHPAGDDRAHGRVSVDRRHQGGDRPDGSGLADRGPLQSDHSVRRRQPDAAAAVDWG